jgi:C1q domain-containing protein
MGFDLAGTELKSAQGLSVMSGASTFLQISPTGLFRRNAMQPMFRAGVAGTAAVANYGTTGWIPITFSATNVNVGSCYNTTNSRFTAPVNGMYLFSATVYHTGAAAGFVIHGMFWVNGGSTTRRPGGPMHRLNSHGVAAGYSGDNESTEIMTLLAGDYVQFYNNSNSATNTLTPQYSHFEGYLLG